MAFYYTYQRQLRERAHLAEQEHKNRFPSLSSEFELESHLPKGQRVQSGSPRAQDARPGSKRTSASIIQFTNCRLVRDRKVVKDDLWVQNGKILDPQKRFWEASDSGEYAADVVLDCHGLIVAPGYIDLQLNGAFGVDFSTVDIKDEDIQKVLKGVMAQGVTSILATVITSTRETYSNILPRLAPRQGTEHGAHMLGIHLEGPFISVKGAHPENLLQAPERGMDDVMERYGTLEHVKIVTIAPELKGAAAVIKGLRERGIVVSAGHSKASYQEACDAVKGGLSFITHLWNAMVPFHHRDPGLIGMIGSNLEQRPFYSLIVDGIHTHPSSVKIAYRAHPEGAVLITDAMIAMGLGDGDYQFGELKVQITKQQAKIAGTDTLAGSVATMDSCVRKFRKFSDCSLVEAIEAATDHPARCINMFPQKGSLSFGADADIVLLDDDLNVKATFVDGKVGWAEAKRITILRGEEHLSGAQLLS